MIFLDPYKFENFSKMYFLRFIHSYKCTLRFETIFGHWKPLKMMKNDFYFTLNAFFILKIFKFCLDFLIRSKSKLNRSLDQKSKVLYSLFFLHTKLRTIKIYRNWAVHHLFLPHIVFLENKSGSGNSLSASFWAWSFEGKYFPRYVLLLVFTWWDIWRFVYCNFCNQAAMS